jgi:hypothetical protein
MEYKHCCRWLAYGLNKQIMTEIEKKIQEVKNERQNIKNDIAEKMTMLRVREAELRAIESFVDQLNDLKNKTE